MFRAIKTKDCCEIGKCIDTYIKTDILLHLFLFLLWLTCRQNRQVEFVVRDVSALLIFFEQFTKQSNRAINSARKYAPRKKFEQNFDTFQSDRCKILALRFYVPTR